MQMHEFAESVQHGLRRPHAEKTIPATRAHARNAGAQAPDADESRRRSIREPIVRTPPAMAPASDAVPRFPDHCHRLKL